MISKFAQPVAHDLMEVWQKASIPTVKVAAVENKLKSLYEKARACETKNKAFDEGPRLFDICGCQCSQVSCAKVGCASTECKLFHIFLASAPKKCSIRVDAKELPFLFDQRGRREMMIGGVHRKDSIAEKKKRKSSRQRGKKEKNKESKMRQIVK